MAEEFMPEERLDIEAASNPANTRPEIPEGNPITIYLGNKRSAPFTKEVPSKSNSGFFLKKAYKAKPRVANNIKTTMFDRIELKYILLADLISFVAR